ncbi:MAG: efflux RND transporter periplasmic adaptor subunit [Gemmatimonadetes bacterium]|nr:efflux RND transporter periplasmic adaptor subunit [Gemmatimonadota bacterium]
MKIRRKHIIPILIVAIVLILIVRAFMPSPVLVDTATAEVGPMRVTISEEGRTRVRQRYLITAPASGRLARPDLREGDQIGKGDELARITPSPLGSRESAEARARIETAEALVREAEANVARARVEQEEAARGRERAEKLAASGSISRERLERAVHAATVAERSLESSLFRHRAAVSEHEVAQAALLALREERGDAKAILSVVAPVDGRVLRRFEESERVVAAGTPLLEVGDPGDMEVMIDVLSTDAVRVGVGQTVWIEEWGGPDPLSGKVSRVEPAAFTRVSALGVDEQRVNVIVDLDETPAELGDGYRVTGRIIVWEKGDVLKVPSSALFRIGESWGVFAVEDGVAKSREISVGQRNGIEAEILEGIAAGDHVILHPNPRIADGVGVETRVN